MDAATCMRNWTAENGKKLGRICDPVYGVPGMVYMPPFLLDKGR